MSFSAKDASGKDAAGPGERQLPGDRAQRRGPRTGKAHSGDSNTAGFHFATIEQGGTSPYPALAQRTRDVEALRVVLSIGPAEAMIFQTWSDKAGNAPPLSDPTNGLEFPDLNEP